MWTDALLQLSAAQAVTATAFSTNTIDHGGTTRGDPGRGQQIEVDVTVDTTVTAAGAATVTFQLVSSASANLSSPTVLAQTDAIGKAELTAGRRPIRLVASPEQLNAAPFGQRYFGLQYLVGTGPLTAGAFTANVVTDGQSGPNALYARGQTIA